MSRPDDCSLTPGQLARVRKEAERALREAGALGVLPTPVERIMTVARVEEVKDEVLGPGFIARLRGKAEQAGQALRRAVSKVLYRFHSCLNRGIFGVFLGRVRARDMIRFGYLIRGDGWSSAPRSKSGN